MNVQFAGKAINLGRDLFVIFGLEVITVSEIQMQTGKHVDFQISCQTLLTSVESSLVGFYFFFFFVEQIYHISLSY